MTDQELRNKYADLILAFADGSVEKVENEILRLGRTEMHHLCAFLFIRAFTADMAAFRGEPEVTP